MRMRRTVLIVPLLFLCSAWGAVGQQADQSWEPFHEQKQQRDQSGQPLTNDSVVKLVKIGFTDDTLIAMVNNQPGRYSLGDDDVVAF